MNHFETMLPMEDGVRLYTLVLLPDGAGPFPAVFARTPYDPAPSEETAVNVEKTFRAYLENGFAVVWQHCRGRGGSEGEFVPFKGERADGLRTLSWLEKQPFFDGRAYLWGGSYLAYVHLSYLAVAPACVKGAALAVMSCDGSNALFKDGAFKADIGPIWYMSMYRSDRLTHGDPRSTYDAEFRKFPLSEFPRRAWGQEVPSLSATLALNADPLSDPAGYSEAYYAMSACPVPVLLIDGWAEMYLTGMSRMWRQLPADIRAQSAFLVGPWSHGCRVESDWAYPFPHGDLPGDPSLDWLLHLKNGVAPALSAPGMARYYCVGRDEWETGPDLPQSPQRRTLCLTPDRRLADQSPAGEISWRYDPEDPPRFPGGPDSFCTPPLGFAPQPQPNFRPDVISFETAPLTESWSLRGSVEASLTVSCSCPETALTLRLCCVSEGAATVMQQANALVSPASPGAKASVSAAFDPVCWTLRPGEALRLDVASADGNNYFPHPNLPGDWITAPACQKADVHLHFPGCQLALPIA